MQLTAMVRKHNLARVSGRGSIGRTQAKSRFNHQANMAGGIQHENILIIFDCGEHGGRPYMVMEHWKART